jgi:exodeoxyribonuclease V alpha subunit
LPKAYGPDTINEIQVLSPSRIGESGTENLNVLLQNILNPQDGTKKEYKYRETVFREGDRVMQIRNNYDLEWSCGRKKGAGVFNGDIGIIESIDRACLTVNFDDRTVEYDFGLLEDLDMAYAITVHKSQGSEYPTVIMPVGSAPQMLQTRNLLYTAITRAQKRVILVGKKEVVAQMVENARQSMRYTGLYYRLRV